MSRFYLPRSHLHFPVPWMDLAISAKKISAGFIFSLAMFFSSATTFAQAQVIPENGYVNPNFSHISKFMVDYMNANGATAAALEIRKANGERLLHQGYGWLNTEGAEEAGPDAIMRIASITKNIVQMAILKLADDGVFSLDAKAFCLKGETPSGTGCLLRVTPAGNDGVPDANADDITIRHLLEHKAGWDEGTTDVNGINDPMGGSATVAEIMNVKSPPTYQQMIDYQLDQALDYIPGSRSRYSNFGYTVLGYIIERYSGLDFMEYIYQELTDDLGIARTDIELGSELVAGRNAREPRYIDRTRTRVQNLFDPSGPKVPWPDGGFLVQRAAGPGGIISTTSALLDYMSAYWLFKPGPRNSAEGNEWVAGGGSPGSAAIAVQNSPLPGFKTQADWVVMLNTNPLDETLHTELRALIRNTLTKNIAIGNNDGDTDTEQFFTLYVPENIRNLEFRTEGGSGDIDLYVKSGSRPATSIYDCQSVANGTRQSCNIPNPENGTYYAMLRGNTAFSGVSVTGNFK